MRTASSGRARRVSVCTALVLAAGMLLATPASAGAPVPLPSAGQPAAGSAELPDRSYTVPRGTGRASAAGVRGDTLPLADLNGDGWEDVVFRAMDGKLYSSLSDGGGAAFLPARTEVAKDVVPVGDQGGGGVRPEVLVLSGTGVLTMYQDAHPGGYGAERRVGGGWQIYNKVFSPGDFDGDGRADVLARTHAGELYAYLGTGRMSGPLSTRKRVGGGWGVYDQLVGVGDADGDGRGDLYARDTAGRLWFYAATGDPSRPFATRRAIGRGWNTYNQIAWAGSGAVVARDNTGTVYLYDPRGDGTLSPRRKASETGGWAGVAQFANSGSIPHTGKGGVVARTRAGNLYWYGATTRGVLTARDQLTDDGSWAGLHLLHSSSLTPDGFSSLGLVHDGVLYFGRSTIGSGWGVYDALVGPGDLSGDGRGDLLARDRSGVLYLYRGNGYGTAFASRVRVGGGWGAYDKLVGAGDHTGDGRADLLARTASGDLYLYAGTGRASAPFTARKRVGGGWGVYRQIAAPGDLNADGKADLLAVTSGGTLYRYLNTVPGTFAPRAQLATGFGVYDTFS
ncbi:FG-GAP repeat domain-containing protein [Streptomyces sp. NPDC004435]|uniref:FG-GAP repeat domain-containing protein n=1 Tax=Streptomyces sp. NPDC004435 TaxID=3364701 RepID=UPI00367E959F